MKFRKRPVEVDACHADGSDGWPEWAGEAIRSGVIEVDADGCVAFIKTLEGRMLVNPHDMVIRGVAGEIYACKPDIFGATYEPVDAPKPSGLSGHGREPCGCIYVYGELGEACESHAVPK